jgi:hypothetical protein
MVWSSSQRAAGRRQPGKPHLGLRILIMCRRLLRPSRADEQARYGEPRLKKVRPLIESVNDTLKGQFDLEDHGGRSLTSLRAYSSRA